MVNVTAEKACCACRCNVICHIVRYRLWRHSSVQLLHSAMNRHLQLKSICRKMWCFETMMCAHGMLHLGVVVTLSTS